ncbi:MAG TPA: KpsF/GutQ family sugar-phosphate isomerase [Phycisphaerae bacterium]|nr:KpsF/GutQ family sugar-phosphate isomerase [Phycisphaerae bacterium]
MDAPEVDLDLARRALLAEGDALRALAGQIGDDFAAAARRVFQCPGTVVLTGIGKAGLVARKISATLASTGTQSLFLHPVEALHGDLGRARRGDVVIALSHSGRTEELIRLLDHLKARGAQLIALTGTPDSPLGQNADVTVCYGPVEEACPLGLAPTVSTTCMLALGDALAIAVMQMRRLTPEEFAAYHPAGELGRKLLKVEEAMMFRRGEQLALVADTLTLGEALAAAESVPRRTGAMLLVDAGGRLSGILTDADVRRLLLARRGEDLLACPVADVMTRNPKRIRLGELASEAMAVLNRYRIDELPVVDGDDKPVGVIDVQDLLGIKTLGNARD